MSMPRRCGGCWRFWAGDLALGAGQRRGDGEETGHHALDITVDGCRALPVGDGSDGSSGIVADPRQLAELGLRCRKLAAMPLDHGAGASVQVPRAGVIAKPRPGGKHLAELGFSQRVHVGPAAKEGGIARQHRLDRRLLQHDLAQPHTIGIGFLVRGGPPGQMPSLAVIPGKHSIGEVLSLKPGNRCLAPLHCRNSTRASPRLMV